ncbi:MAG: 2-C-methyl-D-erythritol 4-phosphate cytidylyltransferase [Nitriliruptor sp.]|nr:MAG: 2-C-methyl-D-erythritol 4-phosphate cytidylyltransferase [Nitriliruptor sp.]
MIQAEADRDGDPRAGVWGIVLAAGGGQRFGASKQFSSLGKATLVERAVAAAAATCEGVVLVLPATRMWEGPPVDAVVVGAAHRSGSVRAALAAVPEAAEIIVVHGAAHPLASEELFRRIIGEVRSGAAAAAPGLPPSDVVAQVGDGDLTRLVGRDGLMTLQTPCAFRAPLLRAAHERAVEASEDIELVLALGATVRVVPGEPWNVHVVTPDDLALARWWDHRAW